MGANLDVSRMRCTEPSPREAGRGWPERSEGRVRGNTLRGESQACTRCRPLPLTPLAASRLGTLSPLRGAREETRSVRDSKSHPARALARAGLREMRVHDAPVARLLAEHHGRAGDELLAAVMDVLRRRRRAGPLALGAAMAPDDRHLVGNDAAAIERRPITRRDVLSVEFPQP